MTHIRGYAAFKPKNALKEFEYQVKTLKPHEVLVKITHSGICHSDIHLIDNDWSSSKYPFIPGHEIIGTVEEKGSQAQLRVGQRVGIGWQCGACFQCEWCRQGKENSCPHNQATCVGHHGGFAGQVIADGRFAFPIPDAIDPAKAAPLMCAGITVFSPLVDFKAGPGVKVGVVGIGGLGHLALQFARHFGCEVTAFSSTESKKAQALKLGAHHFVAAKAEALKDKTASVDILLSTVSGNLNWRTFLDLLRPEGKLVILGASQNKMNFSPAVLIGDQKSIVGHNTGGRPMIERMLDAAAEGGIAPMIETAPLSKVNEAIAKVRKNTVRYRMVLTV